MPLEKVHFHKILGLKALISNALLNLESFADGYQNFHKEKLHKEKLRKDKLHKDTGKKMFAKHLFPDGCFVKKLKLLLTVN